MPHTKLTAEAPAAQRGDDERIAEAQVPGPMHLARELLEPKVAQPVALAFDDWQPTEHSTFEQLVTVSGVDGSCL